MLTERDLKVLEFIEYNPCRGDVIQKLFYPSTRVANRRLSLMNDYKYLNRYRENVNEHYFYYTGKRPKQIYHMDMTTRTMLWIIDKGYEIINFKREVKMNGIRPDAIAAIRKGDKTGILMIEIERFNNRLPKKIHLYEKEIKSKTHFSTFKILYVCTREVKNDLINIINIKPNELKSV